MRIARSLARSGFARGICTRSACSRLVPGVGALAVLLLIAASTALAQRPHLRFAVIGHRGTLSIDSLAAEFVMPATPAQLFAASARALEEMGIPLNVPESYRDSLRGMVGVNALPKMRKLGNERLSKYFNCGSSMMGQNADNWRVYATVLVIIDAKDADASTLRIAVIGGARDIAAGSTEPVSCGTTGVIETRLAALVKAAVAK